MESSKCSCSEKSSRHHITEMPKMDLCITLGINSELGRLLTFGLWLRSIGFLGLAFSFGLGLCCPNTGPFRLSFGLGDFAILRHHLPGRCRAQNRKPSTSQDPFQTAIVSKVVSSCETQGLKLPRPWVQKRDSICWR